MKLIIPMAGFGKRLRPHTLTTPKPLLKFAGKTIIEHIVHQIKNATTEKITDIGFVIGDFGKVVEEKLIQISKQLGAIGHIYYQNEPLGTAHAIKCAGELLDKNVMIIFADTLFNANFTIDATIDGIIWTSKINDPSTFGVVTTNDNDIIQQFVEKPTTFVSDLAIIGIYYLKDGSKLLNTINYIIDHHILDNGEFQLTKALEIMMNDELQFLAATVNEWLDCGNKDAVLHTHQRLLHIDKTLNFIAQSAEIENCTIIPPVHIGNNVTINKSIIGPFVSLSENSIINNCTINNSIIQSNCTINNICITDSIIGNFVTINKQPYLMNIGDYTTF